MENTWQKTWKSSKEYPALSGSIEADVAIIGGGITGISTAYMLAKEGKKVVVLEKGTLGESSYTAYTTAMIMAEIDTSLSDLIKIFGKEKAIAVWQAGMEAIEAIKNIVTEGSIDCEFKEVPAYIYANDKKEWETLQEDAEIAKEAGFPVTIHDNGADLGIPNVGYYILDKQAKFHPLKYCEGLRNMAENLGAVFYENTEVLEIEGNDPATALTKEGKVIAQWIIIATYGPFNNPKELFAHKGMYKTYMLELSVEKGKFKEALYTDEYTPYHYFRVDGGEERDRIILGGADHRKEIKMDPEKNYKDLLEYADKIFGAGAYKIENKWSGGILESWDGLPFIGRYDKEYPNRLVATAFSGNGMTYSRIAANIFASVISGMENKYANIFAPDRGYSAKAAAIKAKDYLGVLGHGAIKNIFRNE